MKDEIVIADSNTDEWKEWAKEDWEYVDGEYIEIIATPAGITARTSSKGCRVMKALVNWEIDAPWAGVLKHAPPEALLEAFKQRVPVSGAGGRLTNADCINWGILTDLDMILCDPGSLKYKEGLIRWVISRIKSRYYDVEIPRDPDKFNKEGE